MAQLTRNEIVLLLQNILPWGSIGMANEILLTLETNGILCLVEKECAIKHPANTAWDLMNKLKNKIMFDAWDRNKQQIAIRQELDTAFEIGYREGVTACKEAMLNPDLKRNTPTYHCKQETQGA